ncbi:MAG: magnesium chelatase subunit D [Polynucleobacter sp.]|nr:magnesium chelatase subunit D [Polynucleobacter sp.]
MTTQRGQSAWFDVQTTAALLAIDPHGLGGICVKSQFGPIRDAWFAFLQTQIAPSAHFQKIPLQIQDEQLLGGLDLEATLSYGKPIYSSGLLAKSHGGFIVLPMAERVSSHTIAHILQVVDRGAVRHPQQTAELTPCAFGMIAFDEGIAPDESIHPRLAEHMAFEVRLDQLSQNDCTDSLEITPAVIAEARQRLPEIECDTRFIESLMQSAAAFGVDSIRAGLFAVRAAKALAALRNQDAVTEDEVVDAARLVLSHRATRMPSSREEFESDEPDADPDSAEDEESQVQDDPNQDTGIDTDANQPKENKEEPSADDLEELLIEAIRAGIPPNALAQLTAGLGRANSKQGSKGQFGQLQKNANSGRPAESWRGLPKGGKRLDLLKTIRAAVPWQTMRQEESKVRQSSVNKQRSRIQIRADDLHIKRYQQRQGVVTIFLVDASGSSATQRLAEAKGAVEQLLADCYIRRDEVAMIALRGRTADVVLPPTRSLVRAKRNLAALPGGGGTPLATGFAAVNEMALSIRRKGMTPLIVVMTDGIANVTLEGVGGRERAHQDALQTAGQLRAAGHAILFIDTASAPQALAEALANEMNAQYLPLPYINSGKAISQRAAHLARQ